MQADVWSLESPRRSLSTLTRITRMADPGSRSCRATDGNRSCLACAACACRCSSRAVAAITLLLSLFLSPHPFLSISVVLNHLLAELLFSSLTPRSSLPARLLQTFPAHASDATPRAAHPPTTPPLRHRKPYRSRITHDTDESLHDRGY